MMWWLIINTPDRVYAWPGWPEKDADGKPVPPDEDIINRARVAAGFPDHDQWPTDGSAWDVQLTLGEPHPNLLNRAAVGTAEDLRKVDAAAVAKHVDGRKADARRMRREQVMAMVAELTAEDLVELEAVRPEAAAAIKKAKG